MMTRSIGKRSRDWVVQAVHITDPPIDSPAHLALLSKKYYALDKSIYNGFRMLRIRNKWMKKLMKTPDDLGGLTCVHCGRKGLQPWAEHIKDKATLDHRIDIFKGGAWDDSTNFQVLCDSCNRKKSDLKPAH